MSHKKYSCKSKKMKVAAKVPGMSGPRVKGMSGKKVTGMVETVKGMSR